MSRPSKPSFVSPFPTHQDIASLAYDIYVSRGSRHGFDQEHWFEAERSLAASLPSTPPAVVADAPVRPRGKRANPAGPVPAGQPPRRRKAATQTPKTE